MSSDAHYARDGISCGLPGAPHTSRRQPASRLLLSSLAARERHNEGTQQAPSGPGREGPAWTPWHPQHPQAQLLPPTPPEGPSRSLSASTANSGLSSDYPPLPTPPLSPCLAPASSSNVPDPLLPPLMAPHRLWIKSKPLATLHSYRSSAASSPHPHSSPKQAALSPSSLRA